MAIDPVIPPSDPSRRTLLIAAAAVTATGVAIAGPAAAAEPAVWTNFWGLAIRGYDPVAYFTEGRPVEGLAEHEASWNGAKWRFSSADNKAAFEADPEAYAPQFGGYCAWAVSQGYTASVVPEAWDIVDGKLYLNFSKGVQATWRRDRTTHIARGERNWPLVLN